MKLFERYIFKTGTVVNRPGYNLLLSMEKRPTVYFCSNSTAFSCNPDKRLDWLKKADGVGQYYCFLRNSI